MIWASFCDGMQAVKLPGIGVLHSIYFTNKTNFFFCFVMLSDIVDVLYILFYYFRYAVGVIFSFVRDIYKIDSRKSSKPWQVG